MTRFESRVLETGLLLSECVIKAGEKSTEQYSKPTAALKSRDERDAAFLASDCDLTADGEKRGDESKVEWRTFEMDAQVEKSLGEKKEKRRVLGEMRSDGATRSLLAMVVEMNGDGWSMPSHQSTLQELATAELYDSCGGEAEINILLFSQQYFSH